MDIQVKNEDAAMSTCREILSYLRQTDSHVDSLEGTLQEINAAWESTGNDKESYVVELEKQIRNLRIMEQGISDLASNILKYVENIKVTSSSTM